MYDKDLALTALLEYFDLLAVHFESAGLLFSYQLQCLASVSIRFYRKIIEKAYNYTALNTTYELFMQN